MTRHATGSDGAGGVVLADTYAAALEADALGAFAVPRRCKQPIPASIDATALLPAQFRLLCRSLMPRPLEADNLVQGAVKWALRHRHKVSEYLERDDPGERRAGVAALMKVVWRGLESLGRSEKAKLSGYLPEDEWLYTINQIRDVTVALLEGNVDSVESVPEFSRRSPSDPATGGNARAMVVDSQRGLLSLNLQDWDFLTTYLRDLPGGRAGLAEREELSLESLSKKAYRILSKVRAHLGGANPYTGQDN